MTNPYSGNGIYLSRFFQVAYVTRDLDRAVHTFQEQYGIRSFHLQRGNQIDEHTKTDLALAWLGDVMVELIQPFGNGNSFYEVVLGAEPLGTRLHHFGHLVPDRAEWERLNEHFTRNGATIPLQGRVDGFLSYLYVDQRAQAGHFLEYILCEPAGQAFFDSVPRS
jgi:catechol 2,3-dioxygenase-like lactoylglutathione lyase family enzyme